MYCNIGHKLARTFVCCGMLFRLRCADGQRPRPPRLLTFGNAAPCERFSKRASRNSKGPSLTTDWSANRTRRFVAMAGTSCRTAGDSLACLPSAPRRERPGTAIGTLRRTAGDRCASRGSAQAFPGGHSGNLDLEPGIVFRGPGTRHSSYFLERHAGHQREGSRRCRT